MEQAYSSCYLCSKRPEEGKVLFTCSRCKAVKYCGSDCQRKDWKRHRTDCGFLGSSKKWAPVLRAGSETFWAPGGSMVIPTQEDIDTLLEALIKFYSPRGPNSEQPLRSRIEQFIRWLDVLVFRDPSAFMAKLKDRVVPGAPCGRIFKRREPAYMCRTCEVDPTCIQCMSCFMNSNHEGHDTVMVHSGGGGICDCGDSSSWDPAGFCSDHQGTKDEQFTDDANSLVQKLGGVANELDVARMRTVFSWAARFVATCTEAGTHFVEASGLTLIALPASHFQGASSSRFALNLNNDDVTSFGKVISCLSSSTGCTMAEGFFHAIRADARDTAIVCVASKDKLKKRVVPFLASAGIEATVVRVSDSCLLVCEEFVGALASWLEKIAKQAPAFCYLVGDAFLQPLKKREKAAERNQESHSTDSDTDLPLPSASPIAECASKRLLKRLSAFVNPESGAAEEMRQGAEISLCIDPMIVRSQSLMRPNWKAQNDLTVALLSDMNFKTSFTARFGVQYSYLSRLSGNVTDAYTSARNSGLDFKMSKSTMITDSTHLSVQLFTIPSVTPVIVRSHNLLENVIGAALSQFTPFVDEKTGFIDSETFHDSIQNFRLFLDLEYIFRNKDVLRLLFRRVRLFRMYLQLLLLFEGCDRRTHVKPGEPHAEFESYAWRTIVSMLATLFESTALLVDGLATQIKGLLAKNQVQEARLLAGRVVFSIMECIRGCAAKEKGVVGLHYRVDSSPVSINFPVHRLFSSVLVVTSKCFQLQPSNACELFGGKDNIILSGEQGFRCLAFKAHVASRIWARNGLAVLNLAYCYEKHPWRMHMMALDILSVQIQCIHVGPDAAISKLIDAFLLKPLVACPLNIKDCNVVYRGWGEIKTLLCCQELVSTILTVATDRSNLCGADRKRTFCRRVISELVFKQTCTYSELAKLSEDELSLVDVKAEIERLTQFSAPTRSTGSGQYVLRVEHLKHFWPYMPGWSAKDREKSCTNFKELSSRAAKAMKASPSTLPSLQSSPFPPLESYPLEEPLRPFLNLRALLPCQALLQLCRSLLLFLCGRHILLTPLFAEAAENRKNSESEQSGAEKGRLLEMVITLLTACALSCGTLAKQSDDYAETSPKAAQLMLFMTSETSEAPSALWLLCHLFKSATEAGSNEKGKDSRRSNQFHSSLHLPSIRWLLRSLFRLSDVAVPTVEQRKAKHCIQEFGLSLEVSEPSEDEISKRKAKRYKAAKARQKKIMHAMAAKRSRFAANHLPNSKATRGKGKEEEKSGQSPIPKKHAAGAPTCIVCMKGDAEESKPSGDRLGLLGFVQMSKLLHLSSFPPTRPLQERIQPLGARHPPGSRHGGSSVIVKFCGHLVHNQCLDSHLAALWTKRTSRMRYEGMNSIVLSKGEYLCPLCKAISNVRIPFSPLQPPSDPMPKSNEATVANGPSKSMQAQGRLAQMLSRISRRFSTFASLVPSTLPSSTVGKTQRQSLMKGLAEKIAFVEQESGLGVVAPASWLGSITAICSNSVACLEISLRGSPALFSADPILLVENRQLSSLRSLLLAASEFTAGRVPETVLCPFWASFSTVKQQKSMPDLFPIDLDCFSYLTDVILSGATDHIREVLEVLLSVRILQCLAHVILCSSPTEAKPASTLNSAPLLEPLVARFSALFPRCPLGCMPAGGKTASKGLGERVLCMAMPFLRKAWLLFLAVGCTPSSSFSSSNSSLKEQSLSREASNFCLAIGLPEEVVPLSSSDSEASKATLRSITNWLERLLRVHEKGPDITAPPVCFERGSDPVCFGGHGHNSSSFSLALLPLQYDHLFQKTGLILKEYFY